jgi:hypothetical protein
MRDLDWTVSESQPNAYLANIFCSRFHEDSEIIEACQRDLALAASEARIIDFEGAVILGVPESGWEFLSNASEVKSFR